MAIRMDKATIAKIIENGLHFDAVESTSFARQLLRVRAGLFERTYPELKAQRLIPRNTDCTPADEQYTYQVADEYAATGTGSSYAEAAPRADISFREATPISIRPITAAYGFSFQEGRAAAQNGSNLPARKGNAARRAIAMEVNRVLTYGDTKKYGVTMYGLTNIPSANTFTVAAADSDGSTKFKSMTPVEVLAVLNGAPSKVVTDSNDVEHPDTMLLPLTDFEYIASTKLGDGSDTTILKHFLTVSQHITSVEGWYALEANIGGVWSSTQKRIVVYAKDSDVLEYILPVEFEQFAPQIEGMETVTNCHARIAGVIAYRPKGVLYADHDA